MNYINFFKLRNLKWWYVEEISKFYIYDIMQFLNM